MCKESKYIGHLKLCAIYWTLIILSKKLLCPAQLNQLRTPFLISSCVETRPFYEFSRYSWVTSLGFHAGLMKILKMVKLGGEIEYMKLMFEENKYWLIKLDFYVITFAGSAKSFAVAFLVVFLLLLLVADFWTDW